MKPLYLLWTAPFVGFLALHFVEQRAHESELAELRSEIGARFAVVGASRAEAEAARETPRPGPVSSLAAHVVEASARAVEARPNAPLTAATEVREQLEASFARQLDDAGSREAQRTIEKRIAAILPEPSRLRALECRASMCRIETVHHGPESYQDFAQAAFMDPATRLGDGGVFSTPLADPADGELVTVTYLARDGEKLPLLAELP